MSYIAYQFGIKSLLCFPWLVFFLRTQTLFWHTPKNEKVFSYSLIKSFFCSLEVLSLLLVTAPSLFCLILVDLQPQELKSGVAHDQRNTNQFILLRKSESEQKHMCTGGSCEWVIQRQLLERLSMCIWGSESTSVLGSSP